MTEDCKLEISEFFKNQARLIPAPEHCVVMLKFVHDICSFEVVAKLLGYKGRKQGHVV